MIRINDNSINVQSGLNDYVVRVSKMHCKSTDWFLYDGIIGR